jgi:hypothetical protein
MFKSSYLPFQRKISVLEALGGHLPQCLTAGDATDLGGLNTSLTQFVLCMAIIINAPIVTGNRNCDDIVTEL